MSNENIDGQENETSEPKAPHAPKCPACEIEGLEHIISEPSVETSKGGTPWFNVAFCDNCGHVYGIFAKNILSHDMTAPLPSLPFPRR